MYELVSVRAIDGVYRVTYRDSNNIEHHFETVDPDNVIKQCEFHNKFKLTQDNYAPKEYISGTSLKDILLRKFDNYGMFSSPTLSKIIKCEIDVTENNFDILLNKVIGEKELLLVKYGECLN